MTIEYYVKNIYGQKMLYIKDEKIKGCISGLTGKKTIDSWDIQMLQNLGLKFVEVLPV